MKKISRMAFAGLMITATALMSCNPEENDDSPGTPYFKMVVNGDTLEAAQDYIFVFVNVDDNFGIYASGGTVIFNSIELSDVPGPGTYPIVLGPDLDEGGLRFHYQDSIYYINENLGSGTLTIDIFNLSPGNMEEVKGHFQGTASTPYGNTVTITSGTFYYHKPE